MRLIIYILIIGLAACFFIYRQETTPEPQPLFPPCPEPCRRVTPLSDSPAETSTTSTPFSPLTPLLTPLPKPEPQLKPAPAKIIDPETLEQIQSKLNQTNQLLENLEKKSAPAQVRLSQEELYAKAASRVVNFFCQQGSNIRVASGVIISPQGHILTNAHVGEGFDAGYECMIRQGSPARNLAHAKLAMFPKKYTDASTRQEQAENDVSIWKITRLANGDPVSAPFPYYETNPKYYPEINQILSTFSYPSELLGYETLLKNLNLLFAETVVSDFDRDLIISGTGLSSQVGSSGGILVDVYTNEFAGLIFAVSKDGEIAKRKLFSLTPYSVERVVQNETGQTLAQFLAQ
ncbi:MAG: trypsin-like peptidase domain-containing protein [Patescibacteria group bacterium]